MIAVYMFVCQRADRFLANPFLLRQLAGSQYWKRAANVSELEKSDFCHRFCNTFREALAGGEQREAHEDQILLLISTSTHTSGAKNARTT